ncbi:hypothetical protein FKW77_010498 [Venturia effusa]|uniref:SnoaL-like domain-containing protein n=1 Tax=Venturia effusa TaxID=50376 RepID=A0A517L0I5_9PEZI|nr:hypothetical protein FKW77_010498 [Venturia effusa]
MKDLSSILLLLFTFLPSTFAIQDAKSCPYCPPQPATNSEQTAIFNEFLQTFLVEKDPKTAFMRHVAEKYIQHNPMALSGRQTAIDILATFIPLSNFTILRTAVQNGIGFVHYKSVTGGGGPTGGEVTSSIVDILRFEGTCIVEHWDVMGVRTGNETNPLAWF